MTPFDILWPLLYRSPAHTDDPFRVDSEYYKGPSTTDSYHSFIPTDTDHNFTEDLNELSERNLEARYTSPKRIDLRKIAVGGTKRSSSKLQRRRASSPTNGVDARSVSLPIHKKQSLPQLSLGSPSPGDISQPSIQGPGWLFHPFSFLKATYCSRYWFKLMLMFCLSQRPRAFIETMSRHRISLLKLTLQ